MERSRFPVYFFSHGAGPWPWVDELRPLFARSAIGFAEASASLPRPRAVLAISGHWEEREFTTSTSPQPPMVYDFAGFPPQTYRLQYPAAGSPALAETVRARLRDAGLACEADPARGFDHGVFVPLSFLFPRADVPVVMLSLKRDGDPDEHLRAGAALEPLRDEVLIVGSGLTYHNLRRFGPAGAEAARTFEAWLAETVALPAAERARRLAKWEEAPFARAAHPREDHLLPLMVAAGAAGNSSGRRLFTDEVWGVTMGSYCFADA